MLGWKGAVPWCSLAPWQNESVRFQVDCLLMFVVAAGYFAVLRRESSAAYQKDFSVFLIHLFPWSSSFPPFLME